MSFGIELRKVHLKPRGKNSRIAYHWRCLMHRLAPRWWLHRRSKRLLVSLDSRPDRDYIWERVNYYCKLSKVSSLQGESVLGSLPKSKNNYFRDFFEYSRFFDGELKVATAFGDGDNFPNLSTASITKSRLIGNHNENYVLLNLNKVRHFIFLKDKRTFDSKVNKAIYRGASHQQNRIDFMEKYFDTEWVNCGDTRSNPIKSEWKTPIITLYDHLDFKFILSLEGNDVASNLKWIMSSNSIAVMPKPQYETWFMEGKLIPNYHYIEIKEDYSDLPERLKFYIDHPEEAKKIIHHAHEYVKQFQDKDREDLIHLLVLRKYFSLTNPGQKLMK